jgi:hypothetical protein
MILKMLVGSQRKTRKIERFMSIEVRKDSGSFCKKSNDNKILIISYVSGADFCHYRGHCFSFGGGTWCSSFSSNEAGRVQNRFGVGHKERSAKTFH